MSRQLGTVERAHWLLETSCSRVALAWRAPLCHLATHSQSGSVENTQPQQSNRKEQWEPSDYQRGWFSRVACSLRSHLVDWYEALKPTYRKQGLKVKTGAPHFQKYFLLYKKKSVFLGTNVSNILLDVSNLANSIIFSIIIVYLSFTIILFFIFNVLVSALISHFLCFCLFMSFYFDSFTFCCSLKLFLN